MISYVKRTPAPRARSGHARHVQQRGEKDLDHELARPLASSLNTGRHEGEHTTLPRSPFTTTVSAERAPYVPAEMEPAAAQGMRCALCGAGADVHCAADAAFLCAACDAQVHGANFLASRHRRTRVSPPNKGRDDDDHDVSASACSSCLSTADSATTTTAMAPRRRKPMRRPAHGHAVLQGWAKRMGLSAGAARRYTMRALQDVAVAAAATRVPLRVAMAAALWREVAAHEVHKDDGDALRRLEECAGVPARILVAVASSMGRARVKRPAAAEDTEEGWGECA
uniref:Uncharacterized protein n=2 Tax=Avena sativa TaxID=4498 RepID=A0ACD6AFD1_AVESA